MDGKTPPLDASRALGWVVGLPVAATFGLAVKVVNGALPAAVTAAAACMLVGLVIGCVGNIVAGLFSSVAGLNISLVFAMAAVPVGMIGWAHGAGNAWRWCAGWVMILAALVGICRGIYRRTHETDESLLISLLKGFTKA